MIIRKFKKVLASTIIALYFMVYAAPIGMCSVALPPIKSGVMKPVLRGNDKAKAKSTPSSSSLKLEGDISLTKGNPKISLSLRDSDVKQVLRMFADKAGLNIVFHQSVSGKVTLDLVNVPLNNAFKLVMQVTDLTYYVDHNTMVVTSSDAAKNLNFSKREMTSIPVKYVSAMAMANFLNCNIFSINGPGLSNSQIAVTNPATNEVLIFGTENDARMARKVISKFDLPPRETQFVVNHTTPKEMANQICKILFPQIKILTPSSTSGSGSASGAAGGSNAQGGPGQAGTPPTSGASQAGATPSSGAKSGAGATGNSATPNLELLKGLTGGASSIFDEKANISGHATGGADDSSSGSGSGSGDSGSGGGDSSSGSSGGGSDSGSSSSSSSSSDSGSALTLGQNVIACQYNEQMQVGNLTSFAANKMTVSYYPSKGLINVLGGTAQQLKMIKDFITMNDKREPQAYLEVSMIELNDTGTKNFNNSWQIWSRWFSADFSSTGLTTPALYPTFFRGNGYKVVDPDDPSTVKYSVAKFTGTPTIAYSINYLVQNNKARVLANPKILITNGKESVIDLTSDYIKSVKSEVVTSTSGSIAGGIQKTYTIANDNGIKVSITPFISPDGYVTLNLKPNYATIASQPKDSSGDIVATLLSRRNLDLKNVRIKDGETLVIGGMITETETKSITKFPILGELPGIGFFFRNSNTGRTRQEMVIMITPKIIRDADEVVNNSGTML